MISRILSSAPLLALTLLSACSGGDVADAFTPNETIRLFSASKSNLNCQSDPALACTDTLVLSPHKNYANSHETWQDQPQGAHKAVERVERTILPNGDWQMRVIFRSDLPPASYRGKIEFSVFNIPIGFVKLLPSSIDYTHTVQAVQGDMRPLAAISTNWVRQFTHANQAAALNLTLNPALFTRRFSRQAEAGRQFDSLATVEGKYIVSSKSLDASAKLELHAFNENDNNLAWHKQLHTQAALTPLVTADKQVWLSTNDTGLDNKLTRYLRGFNISNGDISFSNILPNSAASISNPNTSTTEVYKELLCGGWEAEVLHRRLQDNTIQWGLAKHIDQAVITWRDKFGTAPPSGTPYLVHNRHGHLCVFTANGGLQFTLPVPGMLPGQTHLSQEPLVIDGDNIAFLDQRKTNASDPATLIMLDSTTHVWQKRWQQSGNFTSQPIAAKNVLYILNQDQLEAHKVSDGSLLWQWPLSSQQDQSAGENLILTNNLIFISAKHRTYALDINTQQVVWSYPFSGKLTMSAQGVLYILGQAAGKSLVVGINLQ